MSDVVDLWEERLSESRLRLGGGVDAERLAERYPVETADEIAAITNRAALEMVDSGYATVTLEELDKAAEKMGFLEDDDRELWADGGTGRVDGELLDRIQELMLDHKGPANTISSGAIADVLGINDSDAQPKTREAIRILTEERGVPIASTSQGYYLIQTHEHLTDYLESLDGRIAGIQKRKQTVIDAWESHLEGAARERGESDD